MNPTDVMLNKGRHYKPVWFHLYCFQEEANWTDVYRSQKSDAVGMGKVARENFVRWGEYFTSPSGLCTSDLHICKKSLSCKLQICTLSYLISISYNLKDAIIQNKEEKILYINILW